MKNDNLRKVSVIGLGYIGLPAAAMFASRKVQVVGVDINKVAVNTINDGRIHIVEPELDMIVHAAVSEGYLRATTKPEAADVFVIAVPTPFAGNHVPDLSYVKAAVLSIAPVLEKGNLIILESTSPVGTTENLVDWLVQARPDLNFPRTADDKPDVHIAYCPERVLPGKVVRELVANDRIIGGISKRCAERAIEVYRVFVEGELLVSDARTAEMSKLTENAFRDVNIAFANELSLICDRLNIDVWELIRLANHHPRVNILQPGCGVGGHCIAVDPWFIVHKTPDEAKLIRAAREINDRKPEWVREQVCEMIERLATKKSMKEIKVACFGLAFKPDIDDLRESPAMQIVEKLGRAYPERVVAVEPNIEELPPVLRDLGVRLESISDAVTSADILVLLVDHKEFREFVPEFGNNQLLCDTKGIWNSRA